MFILCCIDSLHTIVLPFITARMLLEIGMTLLVGFRIASNCCEGDPQCPVGPVSSYSSCSQASSLRLPSTSALARVSRRRSVRCTLVIPSPFTAARMRRTTCIPQVGRLCKARPAAMRPHRQGGLSGVGSCLAAAGRHCRRVGETTSFVGVNPCASFSDVECFNTKRFNSNRVGRSIGRSAAVDAVHVIHRPNSAQTCCGIDKLMPKRAARRA